MQECQQCHKEAHVLVRPVFGWEFHNLSYMGDHANDDSFMKMTTHPGDGPDIHLCQPCLEKSRY